MQECAALVAELLRSRGMAAQVMETAGYPVVYGEYGTGERTLLLYNHYDVQPPDPLDQWDSSPFAAVQRDGKFFARGAAPPQRGTHLAAGRLRWSASGLWRLA